MQNISQRLHLDASVPKIAMIQHETQTLEPLDWVNGYGIRPGFFNYAGSTAVPGGACFTLYSLGATGCELLLFRREEEVPYAVIPFPENYKIGNVYSMIVFGLDIQEFEYAYRLDGPYDPAKGLLFSKENILLDPYAKAVTGQSQWGKKASEKGYHARVVNNSFNWGVEQSPNIPMEEMVIYEMHVRGFTMMDKGVKARGTFQGIKEKIPYLKKLGINAIELMPVFEFDEMNEYREVNGRKLLNYWGYNTVSFFAPNTSYTYVEERNQEGMELKQLIKELHHNGIEVILDVVFNHTAEGNEDGPYISYKGFDNNIYYMLTPDGKYYNFSGCGNTMNCNHPVVQQMILDCLRYWVIHYRVDGFRFDLASILGRNEDAVPMEKPPLVQALAFDPILGSTKLIAEAWDAGGLYQVGNFPAFKRWSEWNGRYRDDIRDFLKGGLYAGSAAAKRIAGSPDIYDVESRGKNASVNFLTCHDGFTMYDLYSYNHKHNEANGWNNTDGADDNRSWNCGVEGETDDLQIQALRMRMIKNACATLLVSRGTPMLLSGDEFCNTQCGNNNAYCQDNEISWLNWDQLNEHEDIFKFYQYMIRFRKQHPVIWGGTSSCSSGMPEISYHSEHPWIHEFEGEYKVIGVMFAGEDLKKQQTDIVYIGINAYWEPIHVKLPTLSKGLTWHIAVNTGDGEDGYYEHPIEILQNEILIGARSVIVLTNQK